MKLSKLFLGYLKLVEKTSKVSINGIELLEKSDVVGFWHEDSFVSHLVLKELAEVQRKATVLVSGKWRGNVIQEMIEHFEGEVFRVSYSGQNIEQFKRLFSDAKVTNNLIVMAFDGPNGPRHKIKKIAFLLANKNNRNLIGVKVNYRRKIRIWGRWDHYVIPLFFNNIQIQFKDFGKITKSELLDTEGTNEKIVEQLI